MTTPLPTFPDTWPATARALHGYARAIAAVPRAHADPHPNWWHVGLVIEGESLVTAPVGLDDGSLRLGLSPSHHTGWMATTDGERFEFPLDAGLSATDFAAPILRRATALGLPDDYDRERFASDEAHPYDPEGAEVFWGILTDVAAVLEQRRAELEGDPGEIHLWPHHFDLSFEWYGTRLVESDGGTSSRAQINLGFNLIDEQYLYSNPWPFDEGFTETPLPEGAVWHTDGWTGSKLPYDALVSEDDWDDRVLDYARTVFRISLPTLNS